MSRTATRRVPKTRHASSLEVKGSLTGLRLRILGEDPEAVAKALEGQMSAREAFFRGASVTLEFAESPIDFDLCARLIPILEAAGVSVTGAVVYEEPAPGATSGAAGLREPRVSKQDEAEAEDVRATEHDTDTEGESTVDGATGPDGHPARLVVGPVRGGQRIASAATIVVFGDVNPGAELASGESVIVWGRVRGAIEAGAGPDPEKAVVCALDLAPARLKIGPVLARAPEEPHPNPEPEVARLEDGHIVVKGWR